MPVARVPIHMSYLLYLGARSSSLALGYLKTAIALCKVRGVAPSFLLHPLDFLGGDVERRLDFFPAMALSTEQKLSLFDKAVSELARHFTLVDMQTHADYLHSHVKLPVKDAAILRVPHIIANSPFAPSPFNSIVNCSTLSFSVVEVRGT